MAETRNSLLRLRATVGAVYIKIQKLWILKYNIENYTFPCKNRRVGCAVPGQTSFTVPPFSPWHCLVADSLPKGKKLQPIIHHDPAQLKITLNTISLPFAGNQLTS